MDFEMEEAVEVIPAAGPEAAAESAYTYQPFECDQWKFAPPPDGEGGDESESEDDANVCYRCMLKAGDANSYASQLDTMWTSNEDSMDEQVLCRMLHLFFRNKIAPYTHQTFTPQQVFAHYTQHVIRPRTRVLQNLRTAQKYNHALLKFAQRKDFQGNEIAPSLDQIKAHLLVMDKEMQWAMRLHSTLPSGSNGV